MVNKAQESEGIEHGRVVVDRALVKSRRPVEDFDGGGNGDGVAEQRKDECRVDGDAGDEHVMRPDQESEDRDGDGREGDEAVAEDALAREAGNDFGDDAHGGQNHDVDRGMRVEPEQVLKQERIAAEFGIEDAEVQSAFGDNQDESDGDDGRSENLDDAGGIVRPDE